MERLVGEKSKTKESQFGDRLKSIKYFEYLSHTYQWDCSGCWFSANGLSIGKGNAIAWACKKWE